MPGKPFSPRPLLLALTFVLFTHLASPASCPAQESIQAVVDEIPLNSDFIEDFPPLGWIHEIWWECDLNGDEYKDYVMVLRREARDSEGERVLVVLLGLSDGTLSRAAVGPNVLLCAQCYGMLAGPDGGAPDFSIKKRVIIISQLSGSREMFGLTLRFRLEQDSGKFMLIGRDAEFTDRGTGASVTESENCLTGKRIIEKFAYDEAAGEIKKVSSVTDKGARKPIPLEEADVVDLSATPTFDDLE